MLWNIFLKKISKNFPENLNKKNPKNIPFLGFFNKIDRKKSIY
jgi:hypothetical protein